MIRDMMPNFELLQPTKLADALTLLDRRGKDIWKMAGGNDSLDWFKDRVKRPKVVMDLGGIAELKYIRETPDGIEIGALTTLSEIANSKVIREKFKVLAWRFYTVLVVAFQRKGARLERDLGLRFRRSDSTIKRYSR